MELERIDNEVRMNRSRSANAYSPPREDYVRRKAWGAPEDDMVGNQMSFGREKYEREARFAAEVAKENMREDYRQASMHKGGSPLRRSPPRSRSFGKNVQFHQ